jgi:antitoxin ParD1/3/4
VGCVHKMKIVTVNIPESYLDSIEKLVGEDGLYPSRSELIRVAVRDFLLRELKLATNLVKYKEAELEKFDDENFVRVPIEKLNEDKEPVREFKTYKIIKRLEY